MLGSVFNEAFRMALAGGLKLDVARTKIRTIADGAQQSHYLLVERYDRHRGVPVQRQHQEDFCQDLGIVSEHK